MKTFTYDDICSWNPCYDPIIYIANDWSGTALDILNMENVPAKDRLWVVLRDELISDKTLRLFAVWCARQVQHLLIDERSLRALDVAERFAHGEATKEELEAARSAVGPAAWSAAYSAAWSTWSAARSAAAAAWLAAWVVADSAARSAWSAAESAAWPAAELAVPAAADSVAQVEQLKKMLMEAE